MNYHDMMMEAGLSDLLGGSRGSNFIARLMAEQKYKNASPADRAVPYRPVRIKGKKQPNPTPGNYNPPPFDPAEGTADLQRTSMSRADPFLYNKLANASQAPSGTNKAAYGASPFIRRHFGNVGLLPETAAQKAARKGYPNRQSAESQEETKEKRAESLKEYRKKKDNARIRDKEQRKPESIRRADRKKKELAELSEAEKKAKQVADRDNKVYIKQLRKSVRKGSEEETMFLAAARAERARQRARR